MAKPLTRALRNYYVTPPSVATSRSSSLPRVAATTDRRRRFLSSGEHLSPSRPSGGDDIYFSRRAHKSRGPRRRNPSVPYTFGGRNISERRAQNHALRLPPLYLGFTSNNPDPCNRGTGFISGEFPSRVIKRRLLHTSFPLGLITPYRDKALYRAKTLVRCSQHVRNIPRRYSHGRAHPTQE